MADTAYLNAKHRREELAKLINEYQQALDAAHQEIARVDTFLSEWRRFAGVREENTEDVHTEPRNAGATSPQGTVRPLIRIRPINPSRETVVEAAAKLIEAAGTPIPRRELLEALKQQGIEIKGKDPDMVLSTMLWRTRNRFVRIPNHGYWFRDRPHQIIGYVPDPSDQGEAEPAEFSSVATAL